ncbi:hypothetical protein RCC89_17690 [Cytophagaceae bacterium ABcell3]|nr:hypothetical protein RCC89_17690 [Cytophagaceae bacterium ABcell3]
MRFNKAILFVLFLCAPVLFSYGQNLADSLANRYCKEVSLADTVTKESFEEILPDIDHEIYFKEPEFVKTVAEEIEKQNISFEEFYANVYSNFSKNCEAYQAIYLSSEENELELKNPDFFLESWCDCFDKHTEGFIGTGDLSKVMKDCNEELTGKRPYRRNVKKELRSRHMSEESFSNMITADFLTQCDLIVNHIFSVRAGELAKSSKLLQVHFQMMENK